MDPNNTITIRTYTREVAAQLALIERKQQALEALEGKARWPTFNIECSDPVGLSQCGNFESLFRGLRLFIEEFFLPPDEMRRLLTTPEGLSKVDELLFANPYWPTAFELYFCDSILRTMFGPDAIQHAEPGSYPAYFRRLFERGLRLPGAAENPFLHHVFLGQYLGRPDCLPTYLTQPAPRTSYTLRQCLIDDVDDLAQHDFVDLSNIMDWMNPTAVEEMVAKLRKDLRPGAVVLYRKLNNSRNLEAVFGEEFLFDHELSSQLWTMDRSLFYSSVHIGQKR